MKAVYEIKYYYVSYNENGIYKTVSFFEDKDKAYDFAAKGTKENPRKIHTRTVGTNTFDL